MANTNTEVAEPEGKDTIDPDESPVALTEPPETGDLPVIARQVPAGTEHPPAKVDKGDEAQMTAFLKLTGYTRKDVIGFNADRRTFVTSNGGKYRLSPKRTQVKVLAGPLPPSAE